MKLILSIILPFIFLVYSYPENTTEHLPIGRLGVQLGTVLEIKGKIVDGESFNVKCWQGVYLIEINEINNSAITNKLYMEFRHAPGSMLFDYPPDHFALHKWKTGKTPKWIDSTETKNLQIGYVGKSVHFLAWETGMFDGIPKNIPEGTPLWSGGSFGFRDWLVLLDDLTKTNSNQRVDLTR